MFKRSLFVFASLAVVSAANAAPQVFYTIRGTGQNNGTQDIWLDYIKYSNNEIYNGFVGPQGIRNFQTGGGTTNWNHRIVAGSGTTINRKISVLDNDGNIQNAELNAANFQAQALQAMMSTNLNYYYDMTGNDDKFSMTLDFANNPIKNKIVYFERGGGGSNSYMQLEAVDANGNKLGNTFLIRPRTSTDIGINTAVYSYGNNPSQSGKQQLSIYDLNVSDLGVSQIQYLRVSMPKGVTLGAGEDFQPDFKIMATRQAVPEPGTMLVLGAGAALALLRRRKSA